MSIKIDDSTHLEMQILCRKLRAFKNAWLRSQMVKPLSDNIIYQIDNITIRLGDLERSERILNTITDKG